MRMFLTRTLNSRQKGNNIFLAVLFFILITLTLFIDPREVSALACAFRGSTGYGCPTCGLSRSFYAFANLNISEAFGYHLLGPIFYISIVILFLKSSIELILDKKLKIITHPLIPKTLIIILAITWLILWINNFY